MNKFFLSAFAFLFAFSGGFSMDFKIWGNLSAKANEKAVMKMSQTGATHVWQSSRLPVQTGNDGRVKWKSKAAREKIFRMLDICAKHKIKLVLLTNIFYEKLSPEKLQQNRWEENSKARSFVADCNDVLKRLDFFISELKGHSAFGGIIIDDEPGVVAGGDVSAGAVKLYGKAVPEKTLYFDGAKLAENNDPREAWFKFQRKTVKKYYSKLYDELKKKHPKTKLYIIPAAPFFSGLQLSIPGGAADEFFKKRRIVTLADDHIKNYKLYVQYYISELSSRGWNENATVDGLWLGMCRDGLPQFCPKPIFSFSEIGKGKTLSAAAFKRFILQTFAEGGKGVVYSPSSSMNDELYQTGTNVLKEYIKPLRERLPELKRLPGRVGIFYSDSNRAMAELWKDNPLERYRQLHYCQALAYYLLKRGIPFEIITETEIMSGRKSLKNYEFVFAAGIKNLSKDAADILENYALDGGKLTADSETGKVLPKANVVDFDAGAVYRALLENVMTPDTLEYQAGLLESKLKALLPESPLPARSSSRDVNINYLTDGENLYLFLVNDNLLRETEAEISFDRKYSVSDIMTEKASDKSRDKINVKISPAGMKVLKLK